jgi:hypothetical protein
VTNRGDKAGTAGVLLHLVCLGFAAAAIVVSFGVASVSVLGTTKQTPTETRGGESGFEAQSLSPRPPQSSDDGAASVPAEAILPSLEKAEIQLPSPGQRLPPSDMPGEDAGTKPNFEPPLDSNAIATAQEVSPVSPIPALPTAELRSPELNEPQQPATKPLPSADVMNATREESAYRNTMPAAPIPDELGERLFRGFQIEHPESAKPDQANSASHETGRVQLQTRRPYDHILSPDVDLRYRVRKECGPINDPELHRHCVASFSAHYR